MTREVPWRCEWVVGLRRMALFFARYRQLGNECRTLLRQWIPWVLENVIRMAIRSSKILCSRPRFNPCSAQPIMIVLSWLPDVPPLPPFCYC